MVAPLTAPGQDFIFMKYKERYHFVSGENIRTRDQRVR